jgi:hypothetical protein
MQRNIPINVDDDFSKVIAKLSHAQSQDIILVVPKDALLFSDPFNLRLLKKRTDLLGQHVSVLTMDQDGRRYAQEAGYTVQGFASMQKRSFGDMARQATPMQRRVERTAQRVMSQERIPERPLERIPQRPQRPPEPVIPPQVYQQIPTYPTYREPQQSTDFFERENAKIDLAKFQPEPIRDHDIRNVRSGGRFISKIVLSVFCLALIIVFLLTAVILPQANITVYAKTNPLLRDMRITVDTNVQQSDTDQLVIPGIKINQDEKFTQTFQSTGISDSGGKATGSVIIYNFTGHLLKLGAATTTLTAGNNVYKLVSDATNIKPTKYFANGTDIDTSTLSPGVTIVADQPGESYNLPQGTRLEIHNSVLGTVPQQLYARNDTQGIAGGSSSENKIVSTSDLSMAQSALPSGLLTAAEQQLQSSKNLILLDTGAKLQNSTVTFDHAVNDSTSSFNGTISGNLSGLAYSQDQLKKLLSARIALTLDNGAYLISDAASQKITTSFASYDPNSSSAILDVHFEGLVSYNVDTASIPAKIRGKNATEVQGLLLTDPNIVGVDIEFSPFWVKTVPRFSNKIQINIKQKESQ